MKRIMLVVAMSIVSFMVFAGTLSKSAFISNSSGFQSKSDSLLVTNVISKVSFQSTIEINVPTGAFPGSYSRTMIQAWDNLGYYCNYYMFSIPKNTYQITNNYVITDLSSSTPGFQTTINGLTKTVQSFVFYAQVFIPSGYIGDGIATYLVSY